MDSGDLIRRARRRANLTQRALAQRAGTSHTTLAAYETGAKVPRVDTLDRILQAAGYQPDVDLRPRPDATRAEREAKGRELRDALELAAQFPLRPQARRLSAARPPAARCPGAMSVGDKMVVLHDALAEAGIEHAFGGALALAWCTHQARGTVDIDVNLFVPPAERQPVLAALPAPISVTADHHTAIERDGQVRLFWNETPVDLFFNTTPYHEEVSGRVRWEPFVGRDLPFLGCQDLAVFKVFFDRTKDWADLEAMHEAGTLDAEHVLGVVVHYLGGDDQRIDRLRRLVLI